MSSADTFSASFTIASEREARVAVDRLTEALSEDEVAVAAFEQPDGVWAVTLHLAEAPVEAALRDLVAATAGDDVARSLAFGTIAAKDWVAASLEGLRPVPAGRFVVHGAHDRGRIAPNAIGIEIEAALAFGTGHHGTTRGCLLFFDEIMRDARPDRILDLGTGTGVLAIAAAKAMRLSVLASDIDAQSVEVARGNAQLNGVGHAVHVVTATGFAAPAIRMAAPFDLIFANILANPLKALAPAMRRHLAPGGLAILSGLLPHQAAGVIAAYRSAGMMLLRRRDLDGWSSLLVQRR